MCIRDSPGQRSLRKLEGGKDVDVECFPEFAGASFREGISSQLCRQEHEAVKLGGSAKGDCALIAVRFPAQISGDDTNQCTRRQSVRKSVQTFGAPSHKQEAGMLPVKRSRKCQADASRAGCAGNSFSCQSTVHWLLDRYHAQKDKVIGAFVDETVNRLWLDIDDVVWLLSLIHISEPTRLGMISYAVFCLKKKKKKEVDKDFLFNTT